MKERTSTLHRWMGNYSVATARSFVSNGGSTAMLSVFVMCWKTKMPRSNSASLWQNTTDISVQILYHMLRKECESLWCFIFLFRFREFQFLLERSRAPLMFFNAVTTCLSHDVPLAFTRFNSTLERSFTFSDTAIVICKFWESFLKRIDVRNRAKEAKPTWIRLRPLNRNYGQMFYQLLVRQTCPLFLPKSFLFV